jgi:hypothetical protein
MKHNLKGIPGFDKKTIIYFTLSLVAIFAFIAYVHPFIEPEFTVQCVSAEGCNPKLTLVEWITQKLSTP